MVCIIKHRKKKKKKRRIYATTGNTVFRNVDVMSFVVKLHDVSFSHALVQRVCFV